MRYEAASGVRSILIAAASLIPSGAPAPLVIEDYAWSKDGRKLLIFTNSKQVWRQNTRGDYWVFDIAAKKLFQIAKTAGASTLMFAKFSPDATRVGYVRENNLFVGPGNRTESQLAQRIEAHHQRHVRLGVRGRIDCDGWRWV